MELPTKMTNLFHGTLYRLCKNNKTSFSLKVHRNIFKIITYNFFLPDNFFFNVTKVFAG